MKKYAFVCQNYGAENFYFEDGGENTVVIPAESHDEAKEKLMALVTDECSAEAETYTSIELPEDKSKYPFVFYVEWDVAEDGSLIYGKFQCRPDFYLSKEDFIDDYIMDAINNMPDDYIWEGVINPPVDEAYASDFYRDFARYYLMQTIEDGTSFEFDTYSNVEHEVFEWLRKICDNFCTNDSLLNEFMAFTGMEMPEWEE